MCGISGIISLENNSINKKEIKAINDLVIHRGPDDEGYFYSNNFAFGHRRLSILDLSSLGHQPMEYMSKYVIIHNGEIYNYIELKKLLLKEGYSFKSNTDTEVILAAYDKWKENCVKYFNGMWAFAIYDKIKDTIFFSRDRFGIKPFYYSIIDNKFIFASEIKQILFFKNKRYVNLDVLTDFLITGISDYNEETFFNDIYRLKPSHNMLYNLNTHEYEIYKYYDIKEKPAAEINKNNNVIDNIKKNLDNSVQIRLRSDVKVGTCLSGGLDSSTIASIASIKNKRETSKKFTAITAKSEQKDVDESEYAKMVVQKHDMDWYVVEPNNEDFKLNIDKVIYAQE